MAKKSVIREYAESLLIAVVLALFVRTFVFQAFQIPTGSMENNLLIGDHLIINKMVFAPAASGLERSILPGRDIARGDIIVFKYPQAPERDFIKRVIGLPGDKLEVRKKVVYINDVAQDETRYVQHVLPPTPEGSVPVGDRRREEYGPVTVPPDQYFMMGDNRDNSEDSRYWGFLPRSYVKGQALFIYFSRAGNQPLTNVGGIRWGRLLDRVR